MESILPRNLLIAQPALASTARLPAIGNTDRAVQKMEVACLITMGVAAAAAVHFIDFSLKIPGHAIIRVIFPFAFGLALVPRHGAGLSMGVVAGASTLLLGGTHFGTAGVGAMTSMLLCGIVLDFVAARTRSGWPLYAGLATAGLTVNLVAFCVKLGSKLIGMGDAAALSVWLPRAAVSYPLCGLAAGFICAAVLFRFRPDRDPS